MIRIESEVWYDGIFIGRMLQCRDRRLWVAFPPQGYKSVPASRDQCMQFLIVKHKEHWSNRIGDDDGEC